MRVLFITKSHDFMVPRGASILSSVLKGIGHETYLCDMTKENPIESIEELEPNLVAYSSLTGEAKYYIKLNAKIKERFPALFTIMGGPHPTFFPNVVKESTLDAICMGEGEGAICDVLHNLQTGEVMENIPNIVTKNSSLKSILRPLIENLDSLPFPDYGLFYDAIPVIGKAPLKSVMASRGCPYNCTYCFNTKWRKMYSGHGKMIRRHSVDYVIEDIERIKSQWPLSCVKFYDDVFTYRADDWLVEFSQKYKKKIGLPFFILTRYDLLTEDMVKLLKEAGCRTISMSIEAGNPELRRNLLHRRMSDEQIIKASLLCYKYGIYTFTNALLALPESKIEDDFRSIDLAIEAKTTWAEMNPFFPYPGTELGEYSIKKGFYVPIYSKMPTSYQNIPPLGSLSKKEKNAQRNLAVLGPVAVVFPKLRGLIYHLVNLPYNRFFMLAYWVIKNYTLRKKIYYTKTTFWESVQIYIRSLKQDLFRHEEKEEL